MATTSIIIDSTSSGGKKIRKAITDINPDATNEQLKSFAQQFNALSTNTYGATSRVKKTACLASNEHATLDNKLYPNQSTNTPDSVMGSSGSSAPWNYRAFDHEYSYSLFFKLPLDYTGTPEVTTVPDGSAVSVVLDTQNPLSYAQKWCFRPAIPSGKPECLGEIVVTFPEDDVYAATEYRCTIVAAEGE